MPSDMAERALELSTRADAKSDAAMALVESLRNHVDARLDVQDKALARMLRTNEEQMKSLSELTASDRARSVLLERMQRLLTIGVAIVTILGAAFGAVEFIIRGR